MEGIVPYSTLTVKPRLATSLPLAPIDKPQLVG
jgi:hypothetical protein